MPAASATRPIRPSSASTSRTRWPLPSPPIAGLQDIAPMVANRWVTRAVLAPMRAAALAASQPAWPPPMTMTSNNSCRTIIADFYRGATKAGSSKFARCMFHVKRPAPEPGTRAMFHVKHPPYEMNEEILLANTKIPKDHIQNVLNVDPSQEPAQGMSSNPQILRREFLALPNRAY